MHPRSRVSLVAVLAIAISLAAPSAGSAYGVSGAGGQLGFTTPERLDGTVMLGGQVEFERDATRLHLVPNVLYWKVNRQSNLNPNFDVYYHFGEQRRTAPYLGGGLGLNRRSSELTDRSETDLGANLIGGVRFPGGSNHYFVEGRVTASEVSQVAVVGGITFHTR